MTDPEWRRHAHALYLHGSARLSNRAENSGLRTVCNHAAPYQAHVEIQLEPYLTVLRTVWPDSEKRLEIQVAFLDAAADCGK